MWAIALALVNALLQDTLFGHAQGESVFGIVLVFGALVGALGGYLAARAANARRPQAPDAEPDEAAEREPEHDRHPELAAAAVVATAAAEAAGRRRGGLRGLGRRGGRRGIASPVTWNSIAVSNCSGTSGAALASGHERDEVGAQAG